ncbi:MAG: hypothetical protein ACR2FG_00795 [Marmoricola sp.]
MPDSLTARAGQMLAERMADTECCAFPRRTHDLQGRADAFLIVACRHAVAVRRVLVAELEQHGEHQRARQVAHECHAFQLSMLRAKGRLYGATQLAGLSWQTLWRQVVDHFEALTSLERNALNALAKDASADAAEKLAERMYRVETHAPTRPHPFMPSQGLGGWCALAVCSRIDGIWDAFEGRTAPPLVL